MKMPIIMEISHMEEYCIATFLLHKNICVFHFDVSPNIKQQRAVTSFTQTFVVLPPGQFNSPTSCSYVFFSATQTKNIRCITSSAQECFPHERDSRH